MESLLTITEVAKRTGLTAHTLRYYERAGLIASVARGSGGQRRYAASDLDWIGFLLRLRETRMPIGQMQIFARLRGQGNTTAPNRRQMLETHLTEVMATISALQHSATVLQNKIAHYRLIEASLPTASQPSQRKPNDPEQSANAGPLPSRTGKTSRD